MGWSWGREVEGARGRSPCVGGALAVRGLAGRAFATRGLAGLVLAGLVLAGLVLGAVEREARAEVIDARAAILAARKVGPSAFALPVERTVLPNGLVVLALPDPTASVVLVDLVFRAGAIREPSDRSGLAHLVEHLLVTGPTSDTDYITMLETAGAREVNAFTTADTMTFRAVVPPEALPLALWTSADRLARLPSLLDETTLARERRVVDVERRMRHQDVAYGRVDSVIASRLFLEPHPLHGDVIGVPAELGAATLDDVRRFIGAELVASNGVLVVVGRFEPEALGPLVAETLGLLPNVAPPSPPRLPKAWSEGATFEVKELIGRRPRVSLVWRLDRLGPSSRDALELGGVVLANYLDGAFGTEVDAGLEEHDDFAVFRLDLELPYDKPSSSAEAEAESFLRFLTVTELPRELVEASRLELDRRLLSVLDTLGGRAAVAAMLELRFHDPSRILELADAPWRYEAAFVQQIARDVLMRGRARMTVHARPTRPLQPKRARQATPEEEE